MKKRVPDASDTLFWLVYSLRITSGNTSFRS